MSFKGCSVSGCDGDASSSALGRRGYCCRHYGRFKRNGDPLGGRTNQGELLRFVVEVAAKYSEDDCLLWPYGKSIAGYGGLQVENKRLGAHRLVCEIVHGPPSMEGMDTAHSCGVRSCVNPRHLRWATRSENLADRLIHGTDQRGERNPTALLTEVQVRDIFSLRGKKTRREIAESFGVGVRTIGDILSRKNWSHVDI